MRLPRASALTAALAFAGGWAACAPGGEPAGSSTAGDEAASLSGLLVVTNEESGTVSLVSTVTRTTVAEIAVGKRPRGVRIAPNGELAYVALSGSPRCPPWMDEDECGEADKTADGIAEVNLQTRELLRVLPGGSDPETFDITPDGARLVVSNEDSDEASLVDLESGAIFRTVPVGREPEGVRISPDGSLAYVTGETDHDVTVLDTATGDEIARIGVGHRPRDAVFTPDGQFAFVSSEIDGTVAEIVVAENQVSRTFTMPEGSLSMGVALSPGGETLYVANGRARTLSVVDLESGEVTATVEVGERPWGVAVSPDGALLYTANGPSDDVSVVDTTTLEVIARIPVGTRPWGLALVP